MLAFGYATASKGQTPVDVFRQSWRQRYENRCDVLNRRRFDVESQKADRCRDYISRQPGDDNGLMLCNKETMNPGCKVRSMNESRAMQGFRHGCARVELSHNLKKNMIHHICYGQNFLLQMAI